MVDWSRSTQLQHLLCQPCLQIEQVMYVELLSLFPHGHFALEWAPGFFEFLGITTGELTGEFTGKSKNFSFPVISISEASPSRAREDAVVLVGVLQGACFFLLTGLSGFEAVSFDCSFKFWRFFDRVDKVDMLMMRGRGYQVSRPGWFYFRPAADLKEKRAGNRLCFCVVKGSL